MDDRVLSRDIHGSTYYVNVMGYDEGYNHYIAITDASLCTGLSILFLNFSHVFNSEFQNVADGPC